MAEPQATESSPHAPKGRPYHENRRAAAGTFGYSDQVYVSASNPG